MTLEEDKISIENDELVQEIHNCLDQGLDDDEDIDRLEEAMEYYCNQSDIISGIKHSIMLTVDDDVETAKDSIEVNGHLRELLRILTK